VAGGETAPQADALEAIASTDLLLLCGAEPGDNLLPTLAVAGLADRLRRSKRPRVLVSRNPQAVLAAIHAAAGAGLVTHVISESGGAALPEDLPVYLVPDLDDAATVGDMLAQVWLERRRAWMRPRANRGQ
jgi:hypothetical protein